MLRKFRVTTLSITVLAALIITTLGITRTQADSQVFTIYGDKPVLVHGKDGTWNSVYTDPGAVFYHDGAFHMFYNGFNGWPASVQIAYATSPDGLNWTKQGTDPVLKSADVPYAGVAALASSALVTDDGTWVLYFYTWQSDESQPRGVIGRATAPKPTGPWTVDEKPVLEPGSAGTWDELRTDAPSVVHTDSGYVMYYAGYDKHRNGMIGMATSTDGIKWTKYDDPATTDAAFAESDPVLQPGKAGEWDSKWVHQPRVEHTPDGWIMVYRSVDYGHPSTIALGYAFSDDGIKWTRSSHNPVIRGPEVFAKKGFWYTALAYHDDTYYLYIEGQPGKISETSVFVATHKGPLAKE